MSDAPRDAKGIFLAAVDIADAIERAAFVERSCGDDAVLNQRVEDLLRAYGQSGGPLDKLAAALALTLPPAEKRPIDPRRAETLPGDRPKEDVGDVIAGRYKLREELGQGGMGAVFMAQQTQPVKRVVAIKLIKLGMDSKQVLARFEAERQALALMDHPNIAKVLDAGTTDSGRPFFVMELVKGVPITRFCDERQLSPRQRLELFIPVCHAIQHAHQKGIIHRDIKPTNVLVALYDDRPMPKVIDFGVAKATGQQLTDASLMTSFGGIVGTPEYMSPEQAQLNQLDIDTRSDVYALGVLLYELLTGTTPIDRKRLGQGALFEVLRIIREEEPPRPSTRLSTSDALASIAATRATEPSKLAKVMRGELDWIVMKCLEKDRSRRYETANGLAHDLERYLTDEPVEACPPSTAYRMRKFARKHRRPVMILAAIAAVLILGIAGTTWGLFRATLAERAARAAERNALESERKAIDARDAKQTALIAEANQRNRAEHRLAEGLLRPIGFSEESLDPPELWSFADWSAVKESPLKMRVLEIALETPETALRLARRAERAIQSSVGLSPARRAQAIKIVSDKQRDRAADPRIRVAACWLALELGSRDLPAWAESCRYLSDPRNQLSDQFGKFISFAFSRDDPQQAVQLDAEPLLAILESSTDDATVSAVCSELSSPPPRLDPTQRARVLKIFVDRLRKAGGTDDDLNIDDDLNRALSWLAPQLDAEQVKTAWHALVEGSDLQPWTESWLDALKSLSPRLDPGQVKIAADAAIETIEKSKDRGRCNVANQMLQALTPRLEAAQVTRAADTLVGSLERGRSDVAAQSLVELSSRLDPSIVRRAAEAMITTIRKQPKNEVAVTSALGLARLAPRLDTATARLAWDTLFVAKSKFVPLADFAPDGLKAFASRLDDAQVESAADAAIGTFEKQTDFNLRRIALVGLAALAPRLKPAQAERAWNSIVAQGQQARFHKVGSEVYEEYEGWTGGIFAALQPSPALRALAPRLQSSQAKRAAGNLIAILEKPTQDGPRAWLADGLGALAPMLDPAQIQRTDDVLIEMLSKSTSEGAFDNTVKALESLAPSLERAQVHRASDILISLLDKPARFGQSAAAAGILGLAPRLEPSTRDELTQKAANVLLDFLCSFDPTQVDLSLDAEAISSPRSLARLLSHPSCVGDQREALLQRFEELVLYGGKPVFSEAETADGKQPAAEKALQRRFHGLHDAADWIQKNWPDFDLETNCPATWRGSPFGGYSRPKFNPVPPGGIIPGGGMFALPRVKNAK